MNSLWESAWLIWVGMGSLITGRLKTIEKEFSLFTFGGVILSILLPSNILLVRGLPILLKMTSGEIIGLVPMVLSSLLVLLPIPLLSGCLFVLGCRIYSRRKGAVRIGYVYLLEAVGASIGGLLVSLLLIRFFAPLYIALFAGILSLLTVFSLNIERKGPIFYLSGLLILGALIAGSQVHKLRSYSLNLQWRGYEVLACQNSVYANITLTKSGGIYSLFTSGLYNFSLPDLATAERVAHFPLLEHPHPERVLLVGGGTSGVMREILKHPVKQVTYVELDPLIIELSREYLPRDRALDDLRVKVVANMDGRLYIKRTRTKYDIIIINLPDPHTAQLNRFYTREFYLEAAQILKDKGIISFLMHSNPNYIGSEQRRLYISLKETLKKVFGVVRVTPGELNYFLASNGKDILTLDWRILIERLNQRGIETPYMREYYLESDLSKERIDSFDVSLIQDSAARINQDFRPISYYYNIILWASHFKYSLKGLFDFITPGRIYLGFCLLFLFMFSPLFARGKGLPRIEVLVAVATTGFTEITFQIVTLLSFQILYGHVYYKLGLILTTYMIGLILGSLWATRFIEAGRGGLGLFVKTQMSICLYPLILPIFFFAFSRLNQNPIFFALGSDFVFPLLPVIPGLIGGLQFPLANNLYLAGRSKEVGQAAGLTYGLDLLGSCFGALLVSVFLLPIIGIPMTCLLAAALNIISLILLLKNHWLDK